MGLSRMSWRRRQRQTGVRLACHATQDRTKPFENGLLLAHRRRRRIWSSLPTSFDRHTLKLGGVSPSSLHAKLQREMSKKLSVNVAEMLLASVWVPLAVGVIATMLVDYGERCAKGHGGRLQSLFHDGKVPGQWSGYRSIAPRLCDQSIFKFASLRLGASFSSWGSIYPRRFYEAGYGS